MRQKPKWHKAANPKTAGFVAGKAKYGPPNRKKLARLQARQRDWDLMNATSKLDNFPKAFHRPGSMQ